MPESSSVADTAGPFPTTVWTRVLAGRAEDPAQRSRALEELCRDYWPAIFVYVRSMGWPRAEAEDATQDFVTRFLLGEPLRRADPERGRLRALLKQSLRHFLANRRRGAAAQRRGGEVEFVSREQLAEWDEPATSAPPDAAYDHEWARVLLARALDGLRAAYAARGKEELFERLKPGLMAGEDLQPYAALGLAAGVSEAQIKLEVHRARRRLAEALRREVQATLVAGADAEAELRYLLEVLAHGDGG